MDAFCTVACRLGGENSDDGTRTKFDPWGCFSSKGGKTATNRTREANSRFGEYEVLENIAFLGQFPIQSCVRLEVQSIAFRATCSAKKAESDSPHECSVSAKCHGSNVDNSYSSHDEAVMNQRRRRRRLGQAGECRRSEALAFVAGPQAETRRHDDRSTQLTAAIDDR